MQLVDKFWRSVAVLVKVLRALVFGSKPHESRFLLLCSAIPSEAQNGISPLVRS